MILHWLKFTALLFVFTLNAFPQKTISIQLKSEYNFFSLTDLKKLQSESLIRIQGSVPNASALESYPDYYGFQLRFGMPGLFPLKNNLDLGLLGDYSSTGGRIHYRDYSGEIKYDQLIKFYSIGFFFQKEFPISSLFTAYYGASTQVIIANLEFKSLIQIGNGSETEEEKFGTTSVGLEPNIGLNLNKYGFSLGFNLSYLAAIPVEFTSKDDGKNKLYLEGGKIVNLNINGFRLGLTAEYSL